MPYIAQCAPDLLTEDVGASCGRHIFSAPVTGQGGATLLIGLHWFGGTSDRIEMAEPLLMRLLCLAMVQRLPDEALSGAAVCLSGLNEFSGPLSPEASVLPRGEWFSAGIDGLIRKRVAALAHTPDPNEAVSCLNSIREQLVGSVEFVDHEMSVLVERLELGDLSQPDHDDVRHVPGAVARHVPDDTVLTCDAE